MQLRHGKVLVYSVEHQNMQTQMHISSLISTPVRFMCDIITLLTNAVMILYWIVQTLLCLHIALLLTYLTTLALYYCALIALVIIQIYIGMMITSVNDVVEMYHKSELDFVHWIGDEIHYSNV
jgi:hypothetical protein